MGSTREAGELTMPAASDARVAFGEVGGSRLAVIQLPRGLPEHLAERLSPAERAIAEGLIDGASYADIAAARATTARTVANQARAVFRKLGVDSRFELALLAGTHG